MNPPFHLTNSMPSITTSPTKKKHRDQPIYMSAHETKGPASQVARSQNSPQPPPLSLAPYPRERFRSLIDAGFSTRRNAALIGSDAATTGPGAIPIHSLPKLQKLNPRIYAKVMARGIFSDLRSYGIIEIPDVDPLRWRH